MSTNDNQNNQIPLRLVFSLMVLVMGMIFAALLVLAGVSYGFK